MQTIYGIYKRNIFFNPEKGISAFFIRPTEGVAEEYISRNGCVKVIGEFCLQQKNLPLAIEGEWKETDYGPEFHIQNIVESSGTEEDAEDLIFSLDIPITQRNARRIVEYSRGDIFQLAMSREAVQSLIDTKKVDPVATSSVLTKLRSLKRELDLFKFMLRYNGTYEHCMKLMKRYPENALEMLLYNPYEVVHEAGLPFRLIDNIALNNGVEPLSEERINAIVAWCIHRDCSSGNVFINSDQVCRSIGKYFHEIPKTAILSSLNDHPYIKKDDRFPDDFYEAHMLKDEICAAKDFARIMNTRIRLPFHEDYIDIIEKERGFAFGNQQRQAFLLLSTTGFKLLTGDPGTGKTTTVNGLLKYLEMLWKELYDRLPKFALCAPAGRAAQRMKETTNRNALTIHKLIEYQPYGDNEYYKNADDPIDADVVIVDEVSMLGLSTFRKLIAAIKNGTLVLLVGDVNQLQSVEPGNVLQDIIDSMCVDRCHLSEVFRQAEESLINKNAKKIIQGDTCLEQGKDFKIRQCRPEETQEILGIMVNDLLSQYGDASKIQVLAPVKKGSCGIRNGNTILQDIFNPGKGGIWYGYRNYKLNDRIIMMSNNYSIGYYNGDIGYIIGIADANIEVKIGDETVILSREQFSDMDLAYNCTVHKSQGSEYEYLIIVLQEESRGMLDQNLLYTAVTRGKKIVMILYENDTLNKSILTGRTVQRNSHLVQRIHMELHIR